MKISFDIQPLLNGAKSGVGFHEDGIVRNMMEQHPEDAYFLQYFAWKNKKRKRKIAQKYCHAPKVEIQECGWFPGSLYRVISGLLPLPYYCFFGKNTELTHFFNFYIPPGVHGKKVVTVHDMAMKRFPETLRFKTKVLLWLNLKRSLKRADRVVAVSEFTKNEILHFYPKLESKIRVVPNGVNADLFHPDYSKDEIEKVKRKYEIYGEYFLYVGNLEPRKNLPRLIDAYFLAKGDERDFPKLVLAGGKGWIYKEIFETIEKHNGGSDVLAIGYIQDGEVPLLMCGARAFCFVPLYEGFGMPALEAMACGTPTLVTDHSAMSEVAGDAALKVDAGDTVAIAEGLLRLHGGEKKMEESYREKGLRRAKEYSWEKAAESMYRVYQEALNKGKPKRRSTR